MPGLIGLAALSADVTATMPLNTPAVSTATTGTLPVGATHRLDATSGALARTLPSAATAGPGGIVVVKKTDATSNAVTVTASGSDTINVSGSTRTLTLPREAAHFRSDGVSDWTVVASDTPVAQLDARYNGTYAQLSFPAGFTSSSGLAKAYDARRNLYNLDPSKVRRLRAKLGAAAASTGLCRIGIAGDSISAGQGATLATQSWPAQLRGLLSSRGVAVAGTGIVYATAWTSGQDGRWAYSAGWADWTPGIKAHLRQSSTAASTATFTSDLAGTVVEVQYSNASGPFTVTIDGGSAVTVTPIGGSTIGTYTVTGLTSATHTVVVTVTSGTCFLVGAGVRKTTGLLITNGGIGGSTSADWSNTQNYSPMNVLNTYSPDAVFLGLMTNDENTALTTAAYTANMQTIINTYKTNSDVILVAQIPASGLDLTAKRVALYGLADSNNLPLIDLYDRWGTYASANALGLMSDVFHPLAAGYGDYALAVSAVFA